MTRDAIDLLGHLAFRRVAVLGWSDGGITPMDLAMNYSSRIDCVFAHGANLQSNQSIPGSNDPFISSNLVVLTQTFPRMALSSL